MTNMVVLVGNLVRDPETAGKDGTIAKLRVAVNNRVKRDDEWVEEPNYFNVTAFGKLGEIAIEHLSKGRQVAIQGRLHWHAWEKDDQKREAVEIIANQIQFLGSPKDGLSEGAPPKSQSAEAAGDEADEPAPLAESEEPKSIASPPIEEGGEEDTLAGTAYDPDEPPGF